MTDDKGHDIRLKEKNRRTFIGLFLVFVFMVGLTAYSPELYRLFCQVTGFSGTTQVASQAPDFVDSREIEVRFTADVSSDLPWSFKPAQNSLITKLGQMTEATYLVRNLSDKKLGASAVFNVSPDAAGIYFNKIQCFCFTYQTLEPGEEVAMKVIFFVDPEIVENSIMATLPAITLSYTFYPKDEQPAA